MAIKYHSRLGHNVPIFYTVEVRRNGSWTRYECRARGAFPNPSSEASAAEWLHQQARRDGFTAIRCLAQQGSVVEERWLDDEREGVYVPPSWRRRRPA